MGPNIRLAVRVTSPRDDCVTGTKVERGKWGGKVILLLTSRPTWAQALLLIGIAGVAGFLFRGLLPPFVVDEPFWRDFLTSPAMGGAFAVLAAAIAYVAATRGVRVTLRSAQREEWWKRAEWAMNLAISDRAADRDAGLVACTAMLEEATETEAAIVDAVTTAILLAGPQPVDTHGRASENKKKRRWSWLAR